MRGDKRMWRLASRYSTIGIEIAIAVCFGTLGGWWLDRRFETSPYLTLLGVALGIAAAVRTLIRVAKSTKLDDL